jgi:hypothetical protein
MINDVLLKGITAETEETRLKQHFSLRARGLATGGYYWRIIITAERIQHRHRKMFIRIKRTTGGGWGFIHLPFRQDVPPPAGRGGERGRGGEANRRREARGKKGGKNKALFSLLVLFLFLSLSLSLLLDGRSR